MARHAVQMSLRPRTPCSAGYLPHGLPSRVGILSVATSIITRWRGHISAGTCAINIIRVQNTSLLGHCRGRSVRACVTHSSYTVANMQARIHASMQRRKGVGGGNVPPLAEFVLEATWWPCRDWVKGTTEEIPPGRPMTPNAKTSYDRTAAQTRERAWSRESCRAGTRG